MSACPARLFSMHSTQLPAELNSSNFHCPMKSAILAEVANDVKNDEGSFALAVQLDDVVVTSLGIEEARRKRRNGSPLAILLHFH